MPYFEWLLAWPACTCPHLPPCHVPLQATQPSWCQVWLMSSPPLQDCASMQVLLRKGCYIKTSSMQTQKCIQGAQGRRCRARGDTARWAEGRASEMVHSP